MTLIKFKRKKSSSNEDITLHAGEPFYNLSDKRLYIGSKDGEKLENKKHVAEVTLIKDASGTRFQIGEDSTNVIDLDKSGVTASIKWESFDSTSNGD